MYKHQKSFGTNIAIMANLKVTFEFEHPQFEKIERIYRIRQITDIVK